MGLDAEVQGAYTHKSRVGATTLNKVPKMFPDVQNTIGIEARVKGARIMTIDGNCRKSGKPNSRKSMKKGIAFVSGCDDDDYLKDTD